MVRNQVCYNVYYYYCYMTIIVRYYFDMRSLYSYIRNEVYYKVYCEEMYIYIHDVNSLLLHTLVQSVIILYSYIL